jgi:hypothetical protein
MVDMFVIIVLFLIVIQWGYVLNQYVRKPGAPWSSKRAQAVQSADLGGLRSPPSDIA